MTPKYYIGQKVLWNSNPEEFTIVHFEFIDYVWKYSIYNGETYKYIEEEKLTRPPAKLEFGYCAIGDVVVDDEGDGDYVLLDVTKNVVHISNNMGGYGVALTYQEAKEEGWKIKEEKKAPETIVHNGLTYKLAE